jgi:hypothetical protein
LPAVATVVARMSVSEIRGGVGVVSDVAELVIGRVFARPVGLSGVTRYFRRPDISLPRCASFTITCRA